MFNTFHDHFNRMNFCLTTSRLKTRFYPVRSILVCSTLDFSSLEKALRMTSRWFSADDKPYKGYKEAEKNGFDCFMFHDVDLILGEGLWI